MILNQTLHFEVVHMDEKGIPKEEVWNTVLDLKRKDISFGSGRIFGSMCTSPESIAVEVNRLFQESNLGNPGLYPGTMEIENRVLSMLGSLLSLDRPFGHVLSGGTEANITAMYRAKKKTGRKKVVFPRSAHFSVLKAINILDLDPVPIDLDDSFRMSLQDLEDKLTDDVALALCVAGSTELGAVDDVERISEICSGLPLHVDAAFGGFVLPFLKDLDMLPDHVSRWDFGVNGVSSLSIDPHKMGGSTIPAGCLIFREEYPLKYLSVDSPYLTSSKAYTLAGTRDSGAVAAAYAVMRYLGRDGYRKVVSNCMEETRYLLERLREVGLEPVLDPVMNIIAVHHNDPRKVQTRMEEQGFFISRVEVPPALRFVVMPHVTRAAIDEMLPVLENVLTSI